LFGCLPLASAQSVHRRIHFRDVDPRLDVGRLLEEAIALSHHPTGALTIGRQPVGVSSSPDGSKLYIACAGNNALAVLARKGAKWSIAGALPTGWFPAAVAADRTRWEGSLETMASPTLAQSASGQEEVRRLNEPRFDGPAGITNLISLGIRQVILAIKENRTYGRPETVHARASSGRRTSCNGQRRRNCGKRSTSCCHACDTWSSKPKRGCSAAIVAPRARSFGLCEPSTEVIRQSGQAQRVRQDA
jgi:hypothetical protein